MPSSESKIYNSYLLLDDPPFEYFSFGAFNTLTNHKDYECQLLAAAGGISFRAYTGVLVSMVFYLYRVFNVNKLPHLVTFTIPKYKYMEHLKTGF
ncbi:hypothetical protein FOQG_16155 [Fusarium oxysporum f. sp. raphani 54005]|uniref:Uncharacterized protein n=2 Tax=Fusarium oxysporum TaxID=5507 RepID=X0BAP3_FUSOX|nr:hypothetical protein FOQG_16155 [Fusarium oxysporum f. sp. raphani 54005]EXL66558.1 hypothetical protein FOPG_17272 [Fusarium oxysporum f. sp. conglutinans race 2 54008]KAI8401688.1 hypothetical protein FOFC_18557 [Fusarium oxysporum]